MTTRTQTNTWTVDVTVGDPSATSTTQSLAVVLQSFDDKNVPIGTTTIFKSVTPTSDAASKTTNIDDHGSEAGETGKEDESSPGHSEDAPFPTTTSFTSFKTVAAPDGGSSTQAIIYESAEGGPGASAVATQDAASLENKPTNVSGNGTSPGAIAGAAVGGLLGGLLLGCIAAFLFFRKKKHQPQVSYASPEAKAYAPSPPSASPPPDPLHLNQFLALPTPDKELGTELRSLGDLIQAHVENNYHTQPIQPNPHALVQALNNLGVGNNGGLSAEEIGGLAVEPRSRQTAIRHVLTHVLFTSVDFTSKSRLTMLPASIAAFLQLIPPVERSGNQDAINLALSRWRALAAFLLNPSRSIRNNLAPSEAAISPQANGLVNALNTFLNPFVPNNLQQQQAEHLKAVIFECTKLGYALFSQPSDWRFNFSHHSQPGYRMAVVCAGLDKLTTNEGQPYNVPNSVVAPTLVQV